MIKFSIGGRNIDPRKIEDELTKIILESMRTEIADKVGAIRDPDTGEFPTIIVRGDTIDRLTIHVEGSPKLVALVNDRLGGDRDSESGATTITGNRPTSFLSYTYDNVSLAQKLAESFQANGIETWWDRWCVYPGNSFRQKIDEGLTDCTHFLVLLTPESINKPWVNAEMDAGLVRKLNDQCKFLPIRYNLPISSLPPLLAGLHSPSIMTDEDIAQLINDIHGVVRKPPLGSPPTAVTSSAGSQTGYSSAANAIARILVEDSEHGLFADPQFGMKELAKRANLSSEDTKDALYELSEFIKNSSRDHVLVKDTLFAEFDQYWKPWKPADDGLRLAADIVNDLNFPSNPGEVSQRYGWEPRRLNPAISYLSERGVLVDYGGIGTHPFNTHKIVGNDRIRRFVKSRS
jgi:hypothetical protein